MITIKATHSIQLTESNGFFSLTVHGSVVVEGNNKEDMLKLYQQAYDRVYCVDMY